MLLLHFWPYSRASLRAEESFMLTIELGGGDTKQSTIVAGVLAEAVRQILDREKIQCAFAE